MNIDFTFLLSTAVLFFRVLFLPALVLVLSNSASAADCNKYLDSLNKIRAQQRAGYSAQRGNKLKERENKAHKKWWDCKSGRLSSKAKKKSTLAQKKGKTQYRYGVTNAQGSQTYKLPNVPKNGFSSQAIVAKKRYQGNQQKRWLVFYEKPKGCSRPKTMKEFTYCIEDKNNQQLQFEQLEASRAQR